MSKNIAHIIPFTFDSLEGQVVGADSDWVLWGGIGFQRSAAKDGLSQAIDEAVTTHQRA